MKEQYVKVEEDDGIELYILSKVITGGCACEYGHFIDVNTNENLGKRCQNYTLYYDDNCKRLKTPKTDNVKWVND